MAPRTRLLLLLPLLALGTWWALSRGTNSDDVAAPTVGPAPKHDAGPVLEAAPGARGASTTAAKLRRSGVTAEGEAAAEAVRVFGTIVLPEGVAANGGLLLLLDTSVEPTRELARQGLEDGLTFDKTIPYGTDEPTWSLCVVLCVPGVPVRREEFPVRAGERRRIDVEVALPEDPATRVEGRLTDTLGNPLEGFRFALTGSPRPLWSDEEPPSGLDDLLRQDSTQDLILVRTGADGRFEARRRDSLMCYPVSVDPRWVVELAPGKPAFHKQAPLLLEASPAARLRGHVRDAATGEPLDRYWPTIDVYVGGKRAETYKWTCSGAYFGWATAATSWGTGPLEIEVKVRAEHYEPFETRLQAVPDGFDRVLDIALRPLTSSELGEVVVVSDLRDAQGLALGVALEDYELRQTRSGGDLAAEVGKPGDEGTVYRLPAGRHQVLASPRDGPDTGLRWSGELTVVGGGRTTFHVPWPPHGSLRLRHPLRAVEGGVSYSLYNGFTGFIVDLTPKANARETFVPALPVGAWVLTDLTKTPHVRQAVKITDGTETVVALER